MGPSATWVDPSGIDLALTDEVLSHWSFGNPASRTLDESEHKVDSLGVEDAAEILTLDITPHAGRTGASSMSNTAHILDRLKEAVSFNEDWIRVLSENAEDEDAMRKAAAQRALLVRSLQVLRTIFGDSVPHDSKACLELGEDRVTTLFKPHSRTRNTWSMRMITKNGARHCGKGFVAHPEPLEPVTSWGNPDKSEYPEIGFGFRSGSGSSTRLQSGSSGSASPLQLDNRIMKGREWPEIQSKALKAAALSQSLNPRTHGEVLNYRADGMGVDIREAYEHEEKKGIKYQMTFMPPN
ncbi:hypothetical protein I302_104026 [Kwoniella bestiolae CBS 10118]|uniref:Uncharacterized protein n=1 Tax=Kwoniella bestiolae CBS 10118 TaxID=1296100 RepID=A0A1B9GA34_9TREE|nr:hypothetical protein I302_02731 [Kwoniella bestiolae CBS 10118]OCF27881.1 hypothetical protein I302_02731 [Kwoniella bestiolae CBS 10118]